MKQKPLFDVPRKAGQGHKIRADRQVETYQGMLPEGRTAEEAIAEQQCSLILDLLSDGRTRKVEHVAEVTGLRLRDTRNRLLELATRGRVIIYGNLNQPNRGTVEKAP